MNASPAASLSVPRGICFSACGCILARTGEQQADETMAPLVCAKPIPRSESPPIGTLPTCEPSGSMLASVIGSVGFHPGFVSPGLIRPGKALTRTIRMRCQDPAGRQTPPQ